MFIPLEKIDIKQRLVYGTIAAEEVDRSGEILDYASGKAAFKKWSDTQFEASGGKSYGNVRAMHNRAASGKVAQPLHFDDQLKKISACVYIADDQDWQKVQDGVFTGFSPGGGYAKMWQDGKHKRYTPVIVELSLVDVPCQPSATFACMKADGTEELRKFKNADEFGEIEQGFRAKDGRFFKAKAVCEKWNKYLDEMHKLREAAEAEVTHPALEALKAAEGAADKLVKAADAGAEDNEDDEDEEDAAAAAAAAKKKKPKYKMKKDAATADDLAKGFCNVAELAGIISQLHWLTESVVCEQEAEGDASTQPDEMKAAVKTLIEIITAMVAEEGEELGEKMGAEKTVDLPRATADQLIKLIGVEHPTMKKINIIEPTVETQPTEELQKLHQALEKVTGDLAAERKVTTDMTDGMTKLAARLEKIERQPMPLKGPLRAVDRHQERTPAPELKKEAPTGTDTLKMPAGLSPNDQRVWLSGQQRNNK